MKNLINALTLGRIFSGPFVFFLILSSNYLLALFLFLLASLSDFFDGYLARRFNLTSPLGEILDPIADKIMVLFVLIALSLQLESSFIGFLGALMLSRDFWVSALRDMNARNGNKVATKVTVMAKYKTTLQFLSLGLYLLVLITNSSFLLLISHFMLFAAMLSSIYTGMQYSFHTFGRNS